MSKATTKRLKHEQGEEDLPPKRFKQQIFPIRMSEDAVTWLQEVAAKKEVAPSTLARMWILERLSQEGPPSKGEWA